MREFVGWLSADIPELHHVEIPRLADSLERFLAASPPASAGGAQETLRAQVEALHQRIMNIPSHEKGDFDSTEWAIYKAGHREARHAAAELVLSLIPHTERR